MRTITNTYYQIHDKRIGLVLSLWLQPQNLIEVAVFNTTITGCAVWTDDNGQDDLIWYGLTDGINVSGYAYRFFNILYSNHNSTTSLYNLHCYNEDTLVFGDWFYWNFDHYIYIYILACTK